MTKPLPKHAVDYPKNILLQIDGFNGKMDRIHERVAEGTMCKDEYYREMNGALVLFLSIIESIDKYQKYKEAGY